MASAMLSLLDLLIAAYESEYYNKESISYMFIILNQRAKYVKCTKIS